MFLLVPNVHTLYRSTKKGEENQDCDQNLISYWSWSGYISMPNLMPFRPGVNLKMHGNPKFGFSHDVKIAQKNGVFQQTLAKIWSVLEVIRIHRHAKFQAIPSRCSQNARKPIWQSKFAPKWGNSTNCDQNLIRYEDGQDTSTCQISGHSFWAFYDEYAEPPNLANITKIFSLCGLEIWQMTQKSKYHFLPQGECFL